MLEQLHLFQMICGMKLKIFYQMGKPESTIGRPIVPYRKVIDGIMFVLRTGCQWKMLPKEYGSGSTCHRRFQEWMQLGIFEKLWTRLLKIYNLKEESNGHGSHLTVYQ